MTLKEYEQQTKVGQVASLGKTRLAAIRGKRSPINFRFEF